MVNSTVTSLRPHSAKSADSESADFLLSQYSSDEKLINKVTQLERDLANLQRRLDRIERTTSGLFQQVRTMMTSLQHVKRTTSDITNKIGNLITKRYG